MITQTKGNILESKAQAIVNTVNCVGVMGRGIALQFKRAFPDNFKAYKVVCDRKELVPGKVFVFDNATLNRQQQYIINFPTKQHWKGNSKIEYIQTGLASLVQKVKELNIDSIAIPPLGCGLGGLSWPVVSNMIEQAFEALPDVNVYLYSPSGAPAPGSMIDRTKKPKMTLGRASLIALMNQYLAGLMDVAVSLLEIHKLMYFMQESGQQLKLDYAKGKYGPYATNLNKVLRHIEGHFIAGYGDGDDNPYKQIELKQGAAIAAKDFIRGNKVVKERFDRISSLIEGFETPYSMEVLATVHWAVAKGAAATPDDAAAYVHEWNTRKELIPNRHIAIAWDRLRSQGWIEA